MENLRQPKVGDVWARKGSGTRYTILSVGPGGVKGRCKSSFDFDMVRPTAWNDGEGIEGFHENFKLILGAAEFVPAVGDAIGEKSTGEWFILTSVHVTPIGEYGEPPKWSLKGRAWVKGAAPTATGKKWRWQGNGGNFHYGRHLVPKALLDTIWAQEQAKGRLAKAAEELSVAHGMSEGRSIGNPQIKLYAGAVNWADFGPRTRLSAGWEHLPCVTHPELPADGTYWEDRTGTHAFCVGRVTQAEWGTLLPVEKFKFYLRPKDGEWIERPLYLGENLTRAAWPNVKPLRDVAEPCPHDKAGVAAALGHPAEVSRDTQAVAVGSYWLGKTTGVLTYVLDMECDRGIRVSRQEYVQGEGKVWGRPITVRSAKAFCRNYFLATEPSDDHRHSDDPKFLVKPAIEVGTYWTDKNSGATVYVTEVSGGEVGYSIRDEGIWIPGRAAKDYFPVKYGRYPARAKPPAPCDRHPSDPKFIAAPPPDPSRSKAWLGQVRVRKPTPEPKPVGDALFWLGAEGE